MTSALTATGERSTAILYLPLVRDSAYIRRLEAALTRTRGVLDFEIDLLNSKIRVEFDGSLLSLDTIRMVIRGDEN